MNQSADGMLRMLIFMILLLNIFWGIKIYKHIRAGWTKLQKILDATGAILLFGLLVMTIIPILRDR